MKESRADRVTITLGRKIPVEQYGSVDLRISYEQDRQGKEKPEKTIARVEKLVATEFKRLNDMVEKNRSKKEN